MSGTRALVVGAGLGGLRTAEALRAGGYAGEVMVVGDEPWAPYNRPPLSKEALAGELSHESLAFRVRATAADLVWRHGETAVPSTSRAHRDALARRAGRVRRARRGHRGQRTATAGARASADRGRGTPCHPHARRRDRAARRPRARRAAGRARCRLHRVRGGGDRADPRLRGALRRDRRRSPCSGRSGRCSRPSCSAGTRSGVSSSTSASAWPRSSATSGSRACVLTDGTRLRGRRRPRGARVAVQRGVARGQRARPRRRRAHRLGAAPAGASAAPVDGVAVVGDIARFPNRALRRRRLPGRALERADRHGAPGRGRAGGVPPGEGYDEAVDAPWDLLPSFWSDQYDVRLQSFGMPGLADPDGVRLLEGSLDGECIVGYHRGDDLMARHRASGCCARSRRTGPGSVATGPTPRT